MKNSVELSSIILNIFAPHPYHIMPVEVECSVKIDSEGYRCTVHTNPRFGFTFIVQVVNCITIIDNHH